MRCGLVQLVAQAVHLRLQLFAQALLARDRGLGTLGLFRSGCLNLLDSVLLNLLNALLRLLLSFVDSPGAVGFGFGDGRGQTGFWQQHLGHPLQHIPNVVVRDNLRSGAHRGARLPGSARSRPTSAGPWHARWATACS